MTLAFDNDIKLDHIKQHGKWKSEAVWVYLNSTPRASATIPLKFQTLLKPT